MTIRKTAPRHQLYHPSHVMAAAFRYALKAWNSSDRELATLAIAIVASMAGSMVHMSVDLFNSRAQVQLLWVFIGLAAALYRVTRLSPNSTAEPA